MKNKYLLIAAAFALHTWTANAQSPNWLWAKGMGAGNNDYGKSIALDASGNVYTAGYFQFTVDFNPGAGVSNLTSAGLDDIFITKFDSAGNFIWARAIGGTDRDVAFSIAIDRTGNGDVYTTGSFSGTVDFDPGSGTSNLTSAGSLDIFICKLDSAGNFVWARQIGGASYDEAYSIAVDPTGRGDVYTTGLFYGSADFNPGAGTAGLSAHGLDDIFISKLDSAGNFIWAKAMGGTDYDGGYSIALDPAGSGSVYTTGQFAATVDFDPGSGISNITSTQLSGTFIVKLDTAGNFMWAKQLGSTGDDIGYGIAIDTANSGDIYTTGYFGGTGDFDPNAGTFNLISAGGVDIYISKLDSGGNFKWAKAMGGTTYEYGYSLAVDPSGSGSVYTTGFFGGTADFNPGSGGFNLTSAGQEDIFISKTDSAGNFVWAKRIGGSNEDRGVALTLDASGHQYLTGFFSSASVSFGSTALTNASNGVADIFIAKLDNVITGIESIENNTGVSVYPNPNTNHFTITLPGSYQKVEVTVTDISGKILYRSNATATQKIEVNTKDFEDGVYLVQIKSEDLMETKKLIVAK